MLSEPAVEIVHLERHLGNGCAAGRRLGAPGGSQMRERRTLVLSGQGFTFWFGFCRGDIHAHRVAPENFPRVSARTPMLMRKMIEINTSAPAHAWRCQSSYGEMAYEKIWSGSAAMGSFKWWVQNRLPKAVNSRGAVSPAMRATASNTPVTIPLRAVFITIRRMIFQRGMPRASAP